MLTRTKNLGPRSARREMSRLPSTPGARMASAADYESIQSFLECAYGLPRNFFPDTYPCFWRKENTDYSRIHLLEDDGEIVSLVRVFPLDLVLGRARIRVGGIGAVATLPECRGKGHMQRLMQHAIEQMKREGFPLSILWGDRHRYQAFGYETAGRMLSLTITRRGLDKCGIEPLRPRRYKGQPDLLSQIRHAYESHPCRRARTPLEFQLTCEHKHLLLYGAPRHQPFGYLGLLHESNRYSLAEYGGDPATVLRIARHLMGHYRLDSLIFPVPGLQPVPLPFADAASERRVESTGMIKILDLARTVQLLRLRGEDRPGIRLSALRAMSELEQVETLFGTAGNSPLNLFVWSLDHV